MKKSLENQWFGQWWVWFSKYLLVFFFSTFPFENYFMSNHNGKYNIYYKNNGSRMKEIRNTWKRGKKTTIRELLFISWHDDFFNILAWICLWTKKIHIKQLQVLNMSIWKTIYIPYILNHFYVIIGIVKKR